MIASAALVLSVVMATPVVVNDAAATTELQRLQAAVSGAPDSTAKVHAQDALNRFLASGAERYRKALFAAYDQATTLEARRELWLEREAFKRLAPGDAYVFEQGNLATLALLMDLRGLAVDPLARFLFLISCGPRSSSNAYYRNYICLGDYRDFDETAARAAFERRVQDPVARAYLARTFSSHVGRITKDAADLAKRFAENQSDGKMRDAMLAGYDGWRELYEANRVLFDATHDLEEATWLGVRDPAPWTGCRGRLEPLLVERMARVRPREWAHISAVGDDAPSASVLRSLIFCANATGRGFVVSSYANALPRDSYVLLGPRTFGLASTQHGPREMLMARDLLVSTGTVLYNGGVGAPKPGQQGRRFVGKVAGLDKQGENVRVRFATETRPEVRYTCSGSGAITGIYRTADGFGVSRDVSCGLQRVGTLHLKPEPIVVPRAAIAGVKTGDFVDIQAPGNLNDAGRAFADALVTAAGPNVELAPLTVAFGVPIK
jgi:hypothetical protein